MDTQDPPNRPRYQLTRGLRGLDNEKDAMTSACLDKKEVRGAIWGMYSSGTGRWLHRTAFSVIWQADLHRPD